MRFITTKVHGLLDYLLGLLLIAAPWLLGFNGNEAATWVSVIVGGGAIGYSLFTHYEWGVVKKIPMYAHLWLDISAGLFLIIAPWLLGFATHVFLPHLLIGFAEVMLASATQKQLPFPVTYGGTYKQP